MKYLLSLCLILVAGCASNEEKTEPKKYSDDTNRAFEMIERGGSYYLKKAPVNSIPAPQIQTPQARAIPERRRTAQPVLQLVERPAQIQQREAPQEDIVIDEKINYQEQQNHPSQQTPTPHVKRNTTKADERLIEINQNLAFYCMKHRKDPRYGGDEAKCMNFVNKTMANCQKVHRIVNSKLLNCIQTKLRR